VDGEFEGQEVK